ncbi:hypothetical protein BH11PSE11_BH11PSE11_34530 [soil metagenome]
MHLALDALRRHFIGGVFLLLCLLLLQQPVGAVGFAHNYGGQAGMGFTTINTVVVDPGTGNRYIAGVFSDTTFTIGGTILTRIGDQDAFVAKLDSSGGVLWAKNFGGGGAIAIGKALAVDGSGNPYLGGNFQSAHLTTPALTKIGYEDSFIIKLDATSGGTTWARNFGGSGATANANALAVDVSGNPYLGGHFQGANLTTPVLPKIGNVDAFVIKLDATSGGTTWAKNFGGIGTIAYGQALAVDGLGNPYLGGYFQSANLTTPSLTQIGSGDTFVIKLDATSGGTTWAKNFGGSGATAFGHALAIDGSGNLYLGGKFDGASLTTPVLTKISPYGYDAFMIKLDAATGSTTWAKNFGSSNAGGSAIGQALTVDGSGNPYLGGYFYGADLTMPALTKIGARDAFVIKLDATTGGMAWAKNFGGSGGGASASGQSLAVDASGNPYLAGNFLFANLTTPALTQIGSVDAFVIKLDATTGSMALTEHYFGLSPHGVARIMAAAVDASGNQHIVGYFSSSVLTLGGTTLTHIGIQDAFVAKLDSSGAVLWAKNFGGSGAYAYGNALALDESGNAYLGGSFTTGNLTNPALTKIGSGDTFVIKLNATTGDTIWVKSFGGSGANAFGQALAVDGSGSPYLGGYFAFASLTTPALTKIGNGDAFVIKLDATSGGTIWAKNFGGGSASTVGHALAVDGSGNPYLGGYFLDANLTTPALTKIGPGDAFVFKLDPTTGSTTWAKNFGGCGRYAIGQALAVDVSGNSYLGGYFQGSQCIQTASDLPQIGNEDAFVFKLDATGGTTWAKNFGGSGAYAYGNVLAVDGSGNPYLGGYFHSANRTTPALTKLGYDDAFVIKLNATTGGTTWAKNFGGSAARAYGNALAVDRSGNPYLGGYFENGNLTTPALTLIAQQDALLLSLVQVNYSGNGSTGGAVPIDNHAYFTGENVTVLSNSGTLIKAGYTFTGWNTAANGSGTNYAATGSASFTMGSAGINLYAQWAPLPTVTGIAPTSGPAAGGTSVTITGTNFVVGATTVTIGGATCTSPSVTSATTLTCTTTAGSAGAASVLVNASGGTNAPNTLYTYVGPPTVTSISASNLSQTGATLNGIVNANGASTAVTFDYGPTVAYGAHVAAIPATVASGGSTASVAVSGLNCNSAYHFRINGVNSAGTTNGNDLSFTTSMCPGTIPGAPTITATTPGPGNATISFTAPTNSGGTPISSYIVTCTATGQSARSASGPGSPIVVLGMRAGVTYSCSAAAMNGVGTGPSSQSLQVQPKSNNIIPEIMLLLLG